MKRLVILLTLLLLAASCAGGQKDLVQKNISKQPAIIAEYVTKQSTKVVFPEVKEYAEFAIFRETRKIKAWGSCEGYITKAWTDKYIRLRIYMPDFILGGLYIRYFREAWYRLEDESFIEDEIHPYSMRKKALVDINIFDDDPEYRKKFYRVKGFMVLRNMTDKERELIDHWFAEVYKSF